MASVSAKAVIKNLITIIRFTIDSELSLLAHINNIARVAFFHLQIKEAVVPPGP